MTCTVVISFNAGSEFRLFMTTGRAARKRPGAPELRKTFSAANDGLAERRESLAPLHAKARPSVESDSFRCQRRFPGASRGGSSGQRRFSRASGLRSPLPIWKSLPTTPMLPQRGNNIFRRPSTATARLPGTRCTDCGTCTTSAAFYAANESRLLMTVGAGS